MIRNRIRNRPVMWIRYPGSGIRENCSVSDIPDPGSVKSFQDPISGIRDPNIFFNIRYPGFGIRNVISISDIRDPGFENQNILNVIFLRIYFYAVVICNINLYNLKPFLGVRVKEI